MLSPGWRTTKNRKKKSTPTPTRNSSVSRYTLRQRRKTVKGHLKFA